MLSLVASFLIQHYVRLFVVRCQNRLANRLVEDFITAPYTWFLQQNSVSKPHFAQTDVLMWANDGILRIMQMIGSTTLLLVASIVLIFISLETGIIGLFLVLLFSILIMTFTRAPISRLSEVRRTSNTTALSSLSQIFRGIKDVRINNSEFFFKRNFLDAFSIYGFSGANLRFFQNISPAAIMALGQIFLIQFQFICG